MMFIKTLFKGNFLKKIHSGQFLESNEKIPQIIQVYESSINLSFCEFDQEIQQYTQTPIYHQNFFFIIFDSGIINNKLILLTSVGLIILKFDGNKWNVVLSEVFNINCEERDKLMYLEINESLGIIICYSNTQLFSVYKFNENSLIKLNKNVLCTSKYIRKIFIFEEKDFFIVSLLTQNSTDYTYENLCFSKNNFIEINLNENKLFESYDKFTKQLIEVIGKEIQNEIDIDIIFDYKLHYIFVISEKLALIFKIDSIVNFDEQKDQIEFKCRFEFKNKNPIFIKHYQTNSSFFFFFDKKFLMYTEKKENELIYIQRKKLIPKVNKRTLFGKSILKLEDNNYLFYDCKGSLIFVNFEENNEQCIIKIFNKLENEGMFSYDSTSVQFEKEKLKIYSLCGIKGESRLIRYVDGFIENQLFETNINEEMSKIIFSENPVYGKINNNTELRLFLTSSFFSSNLYIISPNFKINKIKEYNTQGLGIYPSNKNLDEYFIILKNEINCIKFINANYSIIEENQLFNFQNGTQIISHSIFSFNDLIYMTLYLSSRKLKIIELENKKEINEIDIPYSIEISVINNIVLNNNSIAILIGNYKGSLDILYYDIKENIINLSKKVSNVFSIDDNNENSIVPETIKVVEKYIFISTRTGEFCSFIFNEDNEENKNLITVVAEKISFEKIPLYISNIEMENDNNYYYSVDFFNRYNAFNYKISFIPKKEECHKSTYIIKKNCENDIFLICFHKISKYVYLYQTKGKIAFSTFNIYNSPSQYKKNIINQNNIVTDTIYYFNKDEKGVKIISFENTQILIITDKLNFYLFNTFNNSLILKFEIEIDKNTYINSKVNALRQFKMEIPNEDRFMDIICVSLEYSTSKEQEESEKGMILIYELKDNQIIFKRKLILSKIIYDICFLKNYIVIGSDYSLGLITYELNSNNSFEIKNDAKSIQYMNKIISLQSLNNNASDNILIVGDSDESFQLLEFEPQARFNTNGADISNRILMKAFPINNNFNEVFLTEKNGVISIFNLNDEVYEIKNSFDLKECVNLSYNNNKDFVLNSILGSLFNIKIYDNKMKDRDITEDMVMKLEEFQRKVFCEINKIYFNKSLDYEVGMLMNVPVTNAIMIDELFSICDIYKNELYGKISNFDEMVATLNLLSDELYLNIE